MKYLSTVITCVLLSFNTNAQDVSKVLNKYADSLDGYGMIALVAEGNNVRTAAIGFADDSVKMTVGHLMCIGSISKTYTAATIFKLQDMGLLDIDSPFSKYVTIDHPYIDAEITIRQLLNHSSGLAEFADADIMGSVLSNPTNVYTSDYCFSKVDTVDFEKGTAHSYSNTNYLILGLVIEQIMELPLSYAYQELLLTPYELKDTYPYFSKNIRGIAHPFFRRMDLFDKVSLKGINDISVGDGNLVSSVEDVYRFYRLLFNEQKILSAASLKEMTDFEKGKGKTEYGCGIFRKVSEGKELIYHTGRNISYIAECVYIPSEDKMVIIMTNNMDDEYIDIVMPELLGVPLF